MKKPKKIKCLVIKAQEKCQCKDCKLFRTIREINLNMYITMTINNVMMDGLIKLKEQGK